MKLKQLFPSRAQTMKILPNSAPQHEVRALIDLQTSARFELTDRGLSIGRFDSNGVMLDSDPYASRVHAVIIYDFVKELYSLEDLGSSNGTFVNKKQVHKADLTVGDVIVIGGTEFRVE